MSHVILKDRVLFSILWQDTLLLCKVFKVLGQDDELDVMDVLEEAELMCLLKISDEGIEIICLRIFAHEHVSKKLKVVNFVKGFYGGFEIILDIVL